MIKEKLMDDKINQALRRLSEDVGQKVILDDDFSRETDRFLLRSYNTEKFLKENAISEALVGNFPIIIEKSSTRLYFLKTGDYDLNNLDLTSFIKDGLLEEFLPRQRP